jgi:hypothetical protein
MPDRGRSGCTLYIQHSKQMERDVCRGKACTEAIIIGVSPHEVVCLTQWVAVGDPAHCRSADGDGHAGSDGQQQS